MIFKDYQEKFKKSKKEEKPQAVKEIPKKTNFKIDILELKIGKVVYKDYSRGGEPEIKEYTVNIDEKYEDITDVRELVRLIVMKALMSTNLEKIANIPLDTLKSTISGVGKTGEIVEGLGNEAVKTIKNILPLGK